MSEVIQVHDQFYILATAALDPDRTRVLKQGDAFVSVDRFGDLRALGQSADGLFHDGTRFLSRLELRLEGVRPLLLSSSVQADNALFVANLTNPDLELAGGVELQRDTVHVQRSLVLGDAALHQELRLRSYHPVPVTVSLTLGFAADFTDIFEVRGSHRAARGTLDAPAVRGNEVVLRYVGLDDVERRTRLVLDPAPNALDGVHAAYQLLLEPGEERRLDLAVACESGRARRTPVSFAHAVAASRAALERNVTRGCRVRTSNEDFDEWLERSSADLAMMTTETRDGPFPYAGVPWFCCPFGRDALITAFETLWMDPGLARGVLGFLAATQATESDAASDAEPGKILHEARGGEMAALREIPFGRYYGSADATPLFVLLASAYWRRTDDTATIERLWPSIERAVRWIERFGDRDGDGFIEYAARLPTGLRHQGWKDSEDAVSHADGRLAEGPIALCEIQAYAYAALDGAATLADVLGRASDARTLRAASAALRTRFERAFWSDEIGTYVLALDGDKRPCVVRSSNAGHCLFAGVADPARARSAARVLLDATSFTGWGIRTLAANERRYNPMSYHNGSVWPHDNAVVAAGLARQRGGQVGAASVLSGLFQASRMLSLHRMPELFCGFPRAPGAPPTLYPVACAPQAWAAGAVFLTLASCLGIAIDAPRRRVTFAYAVLPEFLGRVEIDGLEVAGASLDVVLHRHRSDVGLDVVRRSGEVEVVAVK
jgi:glycogen debranching enzyme